MAGMARLQALIRSGSSPYQDKGFLLGESPYIDRYLADVLRVWAGSGIPEQQEHALQLFKALTAPARAGFAVACSAGIQPYDEEFTALALRNHDDTATIPEALAYAASAGFQALVPEIHKLMEAPLPHWIHAEAQLALTILKSQGSKDPRGSAGSQKSGGDETLDWQSQARVGDGRILVQPVFYGDPASPGQGGGGGLATLLRDLGGALPSRGMPVLTVALQDGLRGSMPLESLKTLDPGQLLAPGHLLARLPIHLESTDPAGFLKASHRIGRAMDTVLQPLAGSRTVVHLRYLDDASRAAGLAARRLGLSLAMTLAPDPHRNICSPEGKILPRKPEAARELFNRILIGDELLSWSQGVVAIGRNAFAGELAAWFPQLEDTRGRILRGIDEGVDTSPARTDLDASAILCNPRLVLGLAEDRLASASLVCVGRLNPVKGQASLAQAWADSGLWQDYNLVFIGGNLDEPSSEERSIRDTIRSVLRPELQGRLCHLPAQSNDVVRGLLSSFALRRPPGGCDFYVCPSLKEEFGLSILEAMAAGMPVCAPLNGGARTYIRHGTNGFLIDTRDALSLGRDLTAIVGSQNGHELPRWDSLEL